MTKKTEKPTPDTKRVMNLKEYADYLGVGFDTLAALIKRGDLTPDSEGNFTVGE